MRAARARSAPESHRASQPQLSDPGCEWERRELLDLGEAIVTAMPSAWPSFQNWLSAVRGLSDEACASFSVEAALAALTMELRRLWLRFAHEKADTQIKSPLRTSTASTPAGVPLVYGYERGIQPHVLEDRCFAAAPAPNGWAADHVLFSSAQSALAAILHWASTSGFWDESSPHLTFAGNYFETQQVLNIFRRRSIGWSRDKSIGVSPQPGRESRTILIEPVFYDEAANVFDLAAFHRAWPRMFSLAPGLAILDTTLTGPFFPIDELIEPLGGDDAPIVITFRSGLKLDQAGLEMVNVGIVSVYRHRTKLASTHVDVAAQLRHLRTVLGSGLTFDEISTLEAPWFLNREYFHHHSQAVFDNNAHLARELLNRNRLFAQVLHPQFAQPNCRWAKAPYCVLRLPDSDHAQYRLLERVLAYEADRRGIYFDLGGSFGFRGHRFETVIPDPAMGSPFLRVAMGSRSTPSARAVIELLGQIAALPDFAHVMERYESRLKDAARKGLS